MLTLPNLNISQWIRPTLLEQLAHFSGQFQYPFHILNRTKKCFQSHQHILLKLKKKKHTRLTQHIRRSINLNTQITNRCESLSQGGASHSILTDNIQHNWKNLQVQFMIHSSEKMTQRKIHTSSHILSSSLFIVPGTYLRITYDASTILSQALK